MKVPIHCDNETEDDKIYNKERCEQDISINKSGYINIADMTCLDDKKQYRNVTTIKTRTSFKYAIKTRTCYNTNMDDLLFTEQTLPSPQRINVCFSVFWHPVEIIIY